MIRALLIILFFTVIPNFFAALRFNVRTDLRGSTLGRFFIFVPDRISLAISPACFPISKASMLTDIIAPRSRYLSENVRTGLLFSREHRNKYSTVSGVTTVVSGNIQKE